MSSAVETITADGEFRCILVHRSSQLRPSASLGTGDLVERIFPGWELLGNFGKFQLHQIVKEPSVGCASAHHAERRCAEAHPTENAGAARKGAAARNIFRSNRSGISRLAKRFFAAAIFHLQRAARPALACAAPACRQERIDRGWARITRINPRRLLSAFIRAIRGQFSLLLRVLRALRGEYESCYGGSR